MSAGTATKNIPDFQTGDIFVIRGRSFIARAVRLIISIRYGIPMRLAWSHVEASFDGEQNISAEPSGVQLVTRDNLPKTEYEKYDVAVFRLNDMNPLRQSKFQEIGSKMIGRGYAYARYALDAIRIACFFLVLISLGAGLGGFFSSALAWTAGISTGLLLVFTLLKPWLKKKDILTHDCTESLSLLLTGAGVWTPLPSPRNEFPDGILQVLKNLCRVGTAKVIYTNVTL